MKKWKIYISAEKRKVLVNTNQKQRINDENNFTSEETFL